MYFELQAQLTGTQLIYKLLTVDSMTTQMGRFIDTDLLGHEQRQFEKSSVRRSD